MMIALTRAVSPSISRCELTHLGRVTIDVRVASEQHLRYEKCLAESGCTVRRLPAAPEMPDAVFVEDTCVVLDELAIITRPGSERRRLETATMADALRPYRPLYFIPAPCTIDGGDVLVMDRQLFVGMSSRTNAAAVDHLRSLLGPYGYAVTAVPVAGCLHLKSAATRVGADTILTNPAWVDHRHFGSAQVCEVDPSEPFAANALLVNDAVILPSAFRKTRPLLEGRGIKVVPVDVSELAKAEGGVTCCSVVFSEHIG